MAQTDPSIGDGAFHAAESSAGSVAMTESDAAVILTVTGALDLALAPKLQHLFERAARLRPAVVVIDLSGLNFLASAGMAVLVRAHRQIPRGTELRVVAEGRRTLRPLELTRLTDELSVFPTLSAALAGG
jgi:anti-anti-sigma factor